MYLYDGNMEVTTNLKYASSSSNYYVFMMLQNLKKLNVEVLQILRISEARNAELMQTTTAKRLLFARDTL